MNIDQAMQEQDEVDRKGISLMGVRKEDKINDSIETIDIHSQGGLRQNASLGSMGFGSPTSKVKAGSYSKRRFTSGLNHSKEYNENTGAENASINLNKQCLTCSGNSAVTLNAFKIAWLAYSPSTVGYRGQIFSRDFLLSLKQQIMQSYWSLWYNKPPFTENNEINVDLIYENSLMAISNKTSQPFQTMRMRDPAILMEDSGLSLTARKQSRNQNK